MTSETTSAEIKECPICYENIDVNGVCVTNCGHTFCIDCMAKHLQINNSCPMCRDQVSPEIPESYTQDYVNAVASEQYNGGYQQGVIDTTDSGFVSYDTGYRDGSRTSDKRAKHWREKYGEKNKEFIKLNAIYKMTVIQLQKTQTYIKPTGIKRTTSA